MHISCIFTAYNEIEFLQHKMMYCAYHGFEPYVIDNYSNDGTWEWLQDNNIKSHRVDTNDMFDLNVLQKEILDTVDTIKPDWVVYNGADTFPLYLGRWSDKLKTIESDGYNVVGLPTINFKRTGEEFNKTYYDTYFFYERAGRKDMIYKYDKNFHCFSGDNIQHRLSNIKRYRSRDVLQVNYGACKPIAQQKERLARRQKAWENGLKHNYGCHYRYNDKHGYVFSEKDLLDVRNNQNYYQLLDHLNTILVQ